MNRVAELYDIASDYLSLSVGARFIVATHFRLVDDRILAYGDKDKMDHMVFTTVVKNKMLPEFKKFVQAYKKSQNYDD